MICTLKMGHKIKSPICDMMGLLVLRSTTACTNYPMLKNGHFSKIQT
jgi:hypothetical protein